jgi:hypothetical protein
MLVSENGFDEYYPGKPEDGRGQSDWWIAARHFTRNQKMAFTLLTLSRRSVPGSTDAVAAVDSDKIIDAGKRYLIDRIEPH